MNELERICAETAAYEDHVMSKHWKDAQARDAFVSVAAQLARNPGVERHTSWHLPLIGVGLAAAAAAMLIVWHVLPIDSVPQLEEQWVRAEVGQQRDVAFADGSKMVLNDGARARIVSTDSNTRTITLENGSADIHVKHTHNTDWQVLAGPFRVRVVGTHFGVSWNPDNERFAVSLHEGEVSVSGPMIEAGQRVRAGHQLVAVLSEEHVAFGRMEKGTAPAPDEATATPEVDGSPETTRLEGSRRVTKNTVTASGMNPEYLLRRADDARLGGDYPKAETLYRDLRGRYPKTGHAATAAFNLGRMAFDHQKNYPAAVRWLETYLSESKGGTLHRETLGRLMEAQAASGMREPARTTALQYLDTYPDGPHVGRARKIALNAP